MHIDPRLNDITDGLYRVAVKALIINNKKLLVIQELDDEWWSVPGGGIDYGEDAEAALKRELEEEIGVAQSEIKMAEAVAFVTIGAVVDGIPRANLYFNVTVPLDKVKKTDHIVDLTWASTTELSKLYLSPSIKIALDKHLDLLAKG